MKVLISAFSCGAGLGSEPGIGWNLAYELSQFHSVTVLTTHEYKNNNDQALHKNSANGLAIVYFDLPLGLCRLNRRRLTQQVYYYLWQLAAIHVVRDLHARQRFDLCHHVTLVRYWAPSCLAWLNIPFIWGTVGGGEITPKSLLRTLRFKGRIFEMMKLLISRAAEWDPFVRRTARRASRVFASTTDTAERLRKMGVQEVEVQTQVGMTQDELKEAPFVGGVCRFISVGRMIHWKGFILGLEAFARVEDQSSEFWFVGDGACHSELEEFVKINGLQNRVAFFGSLPREEVLQKIAEADVLVHPSFHDSAGLVCLEAMALGRPVVCLNTGGPAELVDESSGYRVAVDSEEVAINGLHEVLETLASCPELRSSMGAAARKRVEERFLWSKKADFFSEVYQQLIAR